MERFAEEFWVSIQGLDKEEILNKIEALVEDVYSDGYDQGYNDAGQELTGDTYESNENLDCKLYVINEL